MSFTIEQIQSLINQKSLDARQLVNLIADYLQANPGGGGASYLVYTASLIQASALVNPTDNVLQNTIANDLSWIRGATGQYSLQSAGGVPFVYDKTIISGFGEFFDTGNPYIPISSGSAIIGYYTMLLGNNDSFIQLVTVDNSLVAADLFSLIGASKLFLPDIRVYP